MPCRIRATVLRVRTVPSAILPMRSYLIWLVSACFNVWVLVLTEPKESPRSISCSFISAFCLPTDVVYCNSETKSLSSMWVIALVISSSLSNSTVYAYLWLICFQSAWNSSLAKFSLRGFSLILVSWPSVIIFSIILSSYTDWIKVWMPSVICCNSSGSGATVFIWTSVRYLSVILRFIST